MIIRKKYNVRGWGAHPKKTLEGEELVTLFSSVQPLSHV